jgi:ABC-type nickel/cobalt efflux system permease component RcnA
MNELMTLLRQGAGNAWLFIPSAIFLGALHGLEPGHSKTMMAAFIIAVRGTLTQAVMLGLAATVSHTAVVWAIALGGMYFGTQWNVDSSEPYLQLASGVMIVGIALWMIWRTRQHQHTAKNAHAHNHAHGIEHQHPGEDHDSDEDVLGLGYQDEHEREHAEEIRHRFANRHVTTGQIIIFGLTGGLIPCPAAITVLLLCLQLKQFALGTTLVLCFSIGLALTMVASGVLAALSVKHVSKRWSGFGEFARTAPYFSGAIIMMVGMYVGYLGLRNII